jgi:hypothetical protein
LLKNLLSPRAWQNYQNERARQFLEKRRLQSGKYAEFKAKYFDRPAQFALDCFTWKNDKYPVDYQLEILDDIVRYKRECARGPRGLGKTSLAAWAVHWFALTRDGENWMLPTTAGSWRQLTKYLWPEIHKWARFIKWDVVGREPYNRRKELLTQSLRLETGEALAVASDNSDLIEGAHADHIFFIYDESKAIKDDTFDATEGSFSNADLNGGSVFTLAVSTPGEPIGRFYDIQSRKPGYEDWHVRSVTLQEAINAKRISEEWANRRKAQWGEGSQLYLNHVKGEFAAGASDGIIPLTWVELANERWEEWQEAGFPGTYTGVGADVSGGQEGNDLSVLAHCYDMIKIKDLQELLRQNKKTATMETAGQISAILNAHRGAWADIDIIGIGAGVVHRLNELGLNAHGFNSSQGTEAKDISGIIGFANWRSAGWWMVREMLDPANGFDICLPPNDAMKGELVAPRYKYLSRGVIQVESKIDLRRRIGRSTDHADPVIYILSGHILREMEDTGEQYQVVYDPAKIGEDF